MNTCNKCKSVKYCNAACKKKHRTKHKKKCDRRVAELYDEKLFKEVEIVDECPICLLTLPLEADKSQLQTCCGKIICHGCIYAMFMSEGKDLCAFCRTPQTYSKKEEVERTKALMEKGSSAAFYYLARCYADGSCGLLKDESKANELCLKAVELGSAKGYHSLGHSYDFGRGVDVDKKKAKYYYELAAMGGHVIARHNVGCEEGATGNEHRAMKHFMISARAGYKESLEAVKEGFMDGQVTKDEYASTLRAYHERQKEMKSKERDMVALIRM